MDCKQAQIELYSSFIDGELTEEEQQDILRHTKKCLKCKDALEEAEELKGIEKSFDHKKEIAAQAILNFSANKVYSNNVIKYLELDKKDRYKSAKEFQKALKTFVLFEKIKFALIAVLILLGVAIVYKSLYKKTIPKKNPQKNQKILVKEPQKNKQTINANNTLQLEVAVYYINHRGDSQILENGTVLSSQDNYFIYVKAPQKCNIYIYQIDATQRVFKLFPNSKLSKGSNPLQANTQHYFPSAEEYFFLDDNVGQEHIFIFATKKPSLELENINNIHKEKFKQVIVKMGVAGVRGKKKKVSIKPHKKNINKLENIVRQIQSKTDFFYKISFIHK